MQQEAAATDKKEANNLRVIALASGLTGLDNNMTYAVWQPFILSLGASMSTLGLLESLGGQSGIVTTLVQPIGGWLCDRFGRKPLIVLGDLALVAAGVMVLVAAVSGDWRWLLPVVILVGATMIAGPAEKSLVAESSEARERGMAYSICVAARMAPGVFAPILGGFLAKHWGYSRFFVLRLGLDVIVLLLVLSLLRETISVYRGMSSLKELLPLLPKMVVPPRQPRSLFWVSAADMFAWGLAGFILLPGRERNRGCAWKDRRRYSGRH
ncbi:MAG: MFS transporter [Anaerolineae bacterium]